MAVAFSILGSVFLGGLGLVLARRRRCCECGLTRGLVQVQGHSASWYCTDCVENLRVGRD